MKTNSDRAPKNRTLSLTPEELEEYRARLLKVHAPTELSTVLGRSICQDSLDAVRFLPEKSVDLLILDPPYNLTKTFNSTEFRRTTTSEYSRNIDTWLSTFRRVLKDSSSIYICSEWRSSAAVLEVAEQYFVVRNRITWEREKGRGAQHNWKNCAEDIWFCTVSDDYTFNVDAVKLRRRVIAPYRDNGGHPKDWQASQDGNFRLTYPSNLWTDITVPFWSMPENTDHPTQKPEKLVAKLVLASSNPDDVVLDPFLGSGTTSVVSKKTRRRFIGIEVDETYCCLAEKRLRVAGRDGTIQGYHDGVFWERNTLAERQRHGKGALDTLAPATLSLFERDPTT